MACVNNCEFVAEMDINQLNPCECTEQYLTACCNALPNYFEDTLVCGSCYKTIYEHKGVMSYV